MNIQQEIFDFSNKTKIQPSSVRVLVACEYSGIVRDAFKRNSEERKVLLIGEDVSGLASMVMARSQEPYINYHADTEYEKISRKEAKDLADFRSMLNIDCKKGHKYQQVGLENHVVIWECRCAKRL